MHAEVQLEGATMGGLSQVLYEDLHTEKGLIMNPSFLEYKMPTAIDMPEIKTTLVEVSDPEGPFGAKGMSEGCQIAPPPAIVNAIYNALGVMIKDLPITLEKILNALEKKEI